MKRFFYIVFSLMFCSHLFSSSLDNVIFLNTGRMNIAANSGLVSLYVTQAMRNKTVGGGDSVKMIVNGIADLAGNFYHDASTNVFGISSLTTTTSTGTFRFVKNHGAGAKRYITTYTDDSLTCATFDRGQYFIAFPNIVLDTNDSLVIPARMGIDATSLHRGVTNLNGVIILRSDQLSGYDYDASLRITGVGNSAALVDIGSVVVEREVSLYRTAESLFPFATPFKDTQLSGYFAGNWVRRPLGNAAYGSTTYVYGNKDNSPADGTIDMDQYVVNPTEALVPGQPYLVKPRPATFEYSSLQSSAGLTVTGASASIYKKGKFIFNGSVYTLTPYSEQLFADDNLISKTASGTLTATVNWLIGNSFTCPISTVELAKLLENTAGLTFSPTLYVYTAGSQSYQPMVISGSGAGIVVSNFSEIPSMSVFMIRLSKVAQNGTLNIGKSVLRHGKFSHGSPSAAPAFAPKFASGVTNQINFKMSQDENDRVYDLAAIGLREDAAIGSDNYDLSKAINPDVNGFQLYTLSSTGSKLSANGIPYDAETVKMAVKPAAVSGNYKLVATNIETLSSEGAWLYDSLTNKLVDLKVNPIYHFSTTATDITERFKVCFSKAAVSAYTETKNDDITNEMTFVSGLFVDNTMILKGLTANDMDNIIEVYNVEGKLLAEDEVKNYPEVKFDMDFQPGVYVVQMKGSRTQTIKLIKTNQ